VSTDSSPQQLPPSHEQLLQEDPTKRTRARLRLPQGLLWRGLSASNERILDRLLSDLAHIVYPVPLPMPHVAHAQGPSILVLPPPSDVFALIAQREERAACDWVVRHLKLQVQSGGGAVLDAVIAHALPFTQLQFAHDVDERRLRSPFAALRGADGGSEKFASLVDLQATIRSDLFFERTMIPAWSSVLRSADHRLNAYGVDFYRHRQLSAITRFNQIRDAWLALDQFNGAIQVRCV
jgi:hypothetical protein